MTTNNIPCKVMTSSILGSLWEGHATTWHASKLYPMQIMIGSTMQASEN
jgi:hypothetical protein